MGAILPRPDCTQPRELTDRVRVPDGLLLPAEAPGRSSRLSPQLQLLYRQPAPASGSIVRLPLRVTHLPHGLPGTPPWPAVYQEQLSGACSTRRRPPVGCKRSRAHVVPHRGRERPQQRRGCRLPRRRREPRGQQRRSHPNRPRVPQLGHLSTEAEFGQYSHLVAS